MKKIIPILLILVFAVACENEIPSHIKDNPPKMILNALFNADQESNDIILGLTGRDYAITLDQASVDVYVNSELKEHITEPYSVPNLYGVKDVRYKTHVKLQPGDVIRIEARTNDGKHHVWSEATVPKPLSINNIDTTMITKKSWWNNADKFLRIKTTFTDDTHQVNYYRIDITIDMKIEAKSIATAKDTIVYMEGKYPLFINEDIVLTDGRPSMENDDNDILPPVENLWGIFDNSRINGTYTMITSARIPYYVFEMLNDGDLANTYKQVKKVEIKVRLKLMSITQTQFFYLKALNIYDSIDYDDFFNLPVKFPSNIEGGTGIFGISIAHQVIIPLEDYVPDK